MLEIILHLNQLFLENKPRVNLKTYTSLLLFLFIIISSTLSAQNAIIKGIVLDENNIPISEVNVSIGIGGTQTNFDGFFVLEVPSKKKLDLVII